MAGSKIEERVLEALETKAAEQGLDIVDVELAGPGSHPTLRVRIDVLEDGPIDMDRVTASTPWISQVIEELDPISGSYELEVSSPGVDRPLRRPSDFARFAGERAEVVAVEPVDDRRSWVGTIVEASDEAVTIEVDGTAYAVPFSVIKKAKLKPDYEKLLADAKKAAKAAKDA